MTDVEVVEEIYEAMAGRDYDRCSASWTSPW